MGIKDKIPQRLPGNGFTVSNIVHLCVRFFQIIMACVVIGFYASDLRASSKISTYEDSKWVFAVVVGSMAAITAFVFGILGLFSQFRTVCLFFAWEWILVILWAVVTGIFANRYFDEKNNADKGVREMYTASIFDLVNLILWVLTAAFLTVTFFRSPRKTLHTGRATL